MKIAYIPGTFFPSPGGAQVQIHNLANIMCEDKHQADVLLFKKTNIKNKKYKINYLNSLIINFVYLCNYYLKIDISFILDIYLRKIIKCNKYEVWHFIFLNYKSFLLIQSLYRLKQKIVVTFQGADLQINKKINYGNRLDKKYNKILKNTLSKINKFTAISNNIYVDLIKIGVKKNKIILIPNGVPSKKFHHLKFKNRYSNSKKINLITVARYAEKKKGFDLIPKILNILIKLKINFEWTIIGKNTSKILNNESVIKHKEKFKIFENIFISNENFFPSKKIIKKYFQSNIYVNLSRIESFGITFVEALCANLPVLTFDTKGANEIIIDKYNGFIIKNNNELNFCKKILILSKNKNYFKKKPFLSSKKYDLDKLKKNYITMYQQDL
jgi:glycosyltransferase involved in cell wall biosynthesis